MKIWITGKNLMKPPKEAFYSNLYLENISNEDSAPDQKVCEVFEKKSWLI